MRKIKFLIAMLIGKLSAFGLRLFGRNATYLPGLIALKISPDLIGHFKKPDILICVTGTNGKTTTSNFITSVLRSAGCKVTSNSFGSNVQAGVATVLMMNSTFTGKHKNEIAVIEVDERSSLLIYPYMAPDYIICNNIMRDSLKRNAHTDFITYILSAAIPRSTKLILNADDIICSEIAPQCKERIYFGMDAEKQKSPGKMQAKDIVYCPVCGGRLSAEYIRYDHIGRVHCESCGFRSRERDFVVTEIDRENGTFTVASTQAPAHCDRKYKLINDNVVNVYNLCGAIALLTQIGIPYEEVVKAFRDAEIVKTRFTKETFGDVGLTMILAKGQNPVAVSRVFSYVSACPGENKCLLIMVDDKADNTNNVENTCWLYDLDYSPLMSEGIQEVIFAGKRCYDHALRCAMTGIAPDKLIFTPEVSNSVNLIDTGRYKDIYLLYDNYLLQDARREAKTLKERCSQ